MMLTTIEYNQIEGIEAIRADWHQLLVAESRASFFHTPEWLEAYWKFFATDKELRILAIFNQKALIGIVPLEVHSVLTKLGSLKVMTTLDDWGDFNGLIGEEKTAIIQAACQHLKNSPCQWDLFEPRWIEESSLQKEDIITTMKNAGLSPHVSEWSSAAMIDFTGAEQSYWDQWSTKERADQRRNEKRLARNGALKYLHYRPNVQGDPRWDLFDQCKQIAEESWQGESTSGTTLSHNSVQGFMQHIHTVAAQLGCLDMNLLYQDDVPIAFSYGYHFRGYVDGLKTGYIKTKKTNGAGRVLLSHIIKDGFACSDHTFNMGSEHHTWKHLWQTESVTTIQYTCFSSSSLRSQLFKINHQLKTTWQHFWGQSSQQESCQLTKISKQLPNASALHQSLKQQQ